MNRKDSALRARFCEAEQGHVFRFYDELTADEQSTLLAQLRSIDLDQVRRLVDAHLAGASRPGLREVRPAEVIAMPRTAKEKGEAERSREVGEEALRAGRVSALVVAGGQATRLGYDAPKGTFPIAPVSGKSLFQLHSEKILALERRYGGRIPFLVLVSPDNRAATERYFEQHGRFGLEAGSVEFVEQGMLPALDRNGRLLLAERGRVFLSPDGHGGVYHALGRSGILDRLAARGVDILFYFQVDNPLVKTCDPVFLGHHLRGGAEFSLKVVRRRDAAEKVGIYAEVAGKPGILEYSDLPEGVGEARDESGNLRYGFGSIAIHAFQLEFLKRLARGGSNLPYHVARKKVPFVDERGEIAQPAEPNGLKFESFVFDGLPLARKVVAMEVARAEEFAPVKNLAGEDSAGTAREAQSALFRGWLEAAGFRGVASDAAVEIGPLYALDREELVRRLEGKGGVGARRILLD